MAQVAFKIPDFWPHNPTTWFRKIESKFRICNITQSSTKYDHLLSALPLEVCSNINDSLEEIDENAADAYEQLKVLLVSRYSKDHWARAFELLKFPEIGDMKPSERMRQMKALLPTDSSPGTYFMASFLLRLPSNMIDHIMSKDFKDCTKMAEYADLLYCRRRGNTITAVNTNYEAAIKAVSSPHDRQQERRSLSRPGRSRRKTPGTYKEDSNICYYHTTRQESASPGASGSRETE